MLNAIVHCAFIILYGIYIHMLLKISMHTHELNLKSMDDYSWLHEMKLRNLWSITYWIVFIQCHFLAGSSCDLFH